MRQARAVAIWACRQASSRLRRAALSCALASAAFLSGLARAQDESSARERQHVRLQLRIDSAGSECPSAGDVGQWVNQLAGRTYIRPEADAVLLVVVERGTSGALSARILRPATTAPLSNTENLAGSENGGAAPTVLRELQDGSSCPELLRAVALSLAVMAEQASHEETRASIEGASLPEVATSGAKLESAPPRPRTLEPSPRAQRPAQPAAIHSRPAQPAGVAPSTPHSTRRASLAPSKSVAPYAQGQVSTSAAFGLNPGGALGIAAGAAFLTQHWSTQARAEYRVSGQTTTRNAERVRGNSVGAELGVCLRVTEAWRGCGVGGYQWLLAQGSGFGTNHSVTLATATLGAELGFELPLGRHVALDFAAAVLLPTAPIALRVLTPTPNDVWTMSPVAGRLLVGLSVR